MKSSDMKLRSGFFYPLNQILKQLISDTCMYGDLRIFPYYKLIYCLMTVKLISIVGIYNFWSAFFDYIREANIQENKSSFEILEPLSKYTKAKWWKSLIYTYATQKL